MAPNDIRPKSSWFITSACLSNSMHGNPPTRGMRWYIGYGSKLGAQKRRLYVHFPTFSNSGVLSGVLIWPNPILICLVQWHVMVFFKTGIHTYGRWNVETNYSICIHIALLVPTPQLALVTTVLAPWPLNSVYNYCSIKSHVKFFWEHHFNAALPPCLFLLLLVGGHTISKGP